MDKLEPGGRCEASELEPGIARGGGLLLSILVQLWLVVVEGVDHLGQLRLSPLLRRCRPGGSGLMLTVAVAVAVIDRRRRRVGVDWGRRQ